jgi:hypothetical protein
MEKCCDACGDGEYYFRSCSQRNKVSMFQQHRLLFAGSRCDIRWLSGRGKTPTLCVFPVFSVAVMEKCCDACGDGNTISGRVVRRHRVLMSERTSIAVSRKSMEHTVAERSGKDADFVCFLYLVWWLWKSVVTLAVTWNTISGQSASENAQSHQLPLAGSPWDTRSVTGNTKFGQQRQRVPMSMKRRLPLTGSRWDIRWLSGRGMTPTLCVFPVFSVAVMEKCCDACGDGEYYFRSSCSASQGAYV